MYELHFGFRENPFNLTPDPRYLYLSPHHRDALNYILYGINERKGFVVITGGIGTGKTTLCRFLVSSFDASVETALIFNPALSDTELLQTIIQEFGISMNGRKKTKKNCIDALNRFLLKNHAEGKNAVLLIDEAQNLSHYVLEQIRLLSNLETDREKLIQIILIGQPELRDLMAMPSLRQLNERITVRYHLDPLCRDDIDRYVQHRLSIAGEHNRVTFSRPAYRLIYRYSRGIPRRINAICDRALLVAYTRNRSEIDWGAVREAVNDLGGGYFNLRNTRLFKIT